MTFIQCWKELAEKGLDMWKRNNVLCLERGFPVGTSPFLMEAK